MDIFRRFILGNIEVDPPSKADENNTSAAVKVGLSSMRLPDPGVDSPQSSQHGRAKDDDCVIEILSSEDERAACSVHDDEGKENAATTSSITNASNTGKSKTTEDAITVSAVLTKVLDLKPTSSPLEYAKSLSVTSTDASNDFDDGSDDAAAASRIDIKSNATTSKEPDASTPMLKLGNATDPKTKEPSLKSSELQPVTTIDNSKLFSPRKRRRKRAKDSHDGLPTDLLSSSSSNPNHSNIRHQVKRRKDTPLDSPNSPIRIVRKKKCSMSPSLFASKVSSNEENLFDFPNEAQYNNERQQMHMDIKSATKSNLPNSSLKHSDFPKTIKRPNHDDSTDMVTSPSLKTVEKLIKEESCSDQEANIEQNKLAESPSKLFPQFKLPPELVPHNNPGVCDYGVIRNSRLRNRSKKADTQDDVLYQNIQGQRRCRATIDGQKMNAQGKIFNRCLNCAEGVFKYCHAHHDLDEYQKVFWEQRKRRDNYTRSSSSVKTNTTPKAKPKSAAISKTNWKNSSESQAICLKVDYSMDDDQNRCEDNDIRRCNFLLPGKGRCSRSVLLKQPGFCNGHVSFAPDSKTKDEIFRQHPGTMPCAAVSKVGSKCKFKALDQCLFCAKHISSPPEKMLSISFAGELKVKKENIKKKKDLMTNSSRKTGRYKGLTAGSKMTSTTAIAKGDKVPMSIEFPRNVEYSKEQVELATSFDNMCFNVYKSKRCWYKRAEGAILCHKCRICHEEGNSFDHIINDDACGDESILFSNKCVKFNRGKQCQNMAHEGKILCSECLESWDKTTKSSLEYSENSGASELETSSDSDTSSDTFSSGSDDYGDSLSDSTNYDAYCMAYTHKEFFQMCKNWEKKTESMDDVEDSRLIKKANNTMNPTDTDGQVKAQYGRVLPHAMRKIVKILELRREDVFLDIGHGVGNTCLHASFCTGCDSRGIEVVSDRHEIADKFRGGIYAEHNYRDPPRPQVGTVDLRLGRLEDPHQKEFLTKGVTRAYVNNFNGVFAERSSKNKDKWFLDDYISAIFASMAPGAIMVTFHPLNLGLDRDSANSLRSKHNLDESDHASYYDFEKILLGQAFCSVKWNKRSGNTNEIFVYKYRRLHQPSHHDAVFLCSNPSCKMATDMVPIPATTKNEDGRCVINHCECKFSPKNLRRRNPKQTSPS